MKDTSRTDAMITIRTQSLKDKLIIQSTMTTVMSERVSVIDRVVDGVCNVIDPDMKPIRQDEKGFAVKRAKAYHKIQKTILGSYNEEHLEVCLKMIEHYERLMLNFYHTTIPTKQQTKGTVDELISLTKLKRRQIRRGEA